MPRKGENIYKRKDGRWEARYIKQRSPNGKAIYGYVYARSYKEVKAKLQECLVSVALTKSKAMEVNSEIPTFASIASEWYQSIAPQVKESTKNKYGNILASYIMPSIGDVPVNVLTYELIASEVNRLLIFGGKKQEGLSDKTVADILSVVRCILKYAVKNGKTIGCNVGAIQVRRCQKEIRVLSLSEQSQLCQYLYSDLNSYNIGILLSLFTGIRIGELCALRWENISLQEQTIRITHTMQRIQDKTNNCHKTKIVITSPKSASSIRIIPIPNHLVSILESYQSTDSGFILTNDTEKYVEPRTMQNKFKKALKNSSIEDANFHSIRHTFATRCVELGFDYKSLSEILGHASVNITMNRYVHPSLELKRQNMQRLSELFAVK